MDVLLEALSSIKRRTPGETFDAAMRKIQIKRWRGRDVITVGNGQKKATLNVRRATTDAVVVWQCFVGQQYEVARVEDATPLHFDAVQAAYERIVKSGKSPFIVDCGANMGASSVWFDLRYPRSKIVAIEPAADNVRLLRSNCGTRENVNILHAGIGSADGEAFLQDSGGGHWGYQTSEARSDTSVQIVSMKTVLDYADHDAVPFILKIDIEGAEKQLFSGGLKEIEAFPVIIFEPHDFYLPGARTASPFFRFHADTGRDFLFQYENVFSIDMKALGDVCAG